jgi:hypothetical protein
MYVVLTNVYVLYDVPIHPRQFGHRTAQSKSKSLDPACPGWTTPGSRTIRGKTHLTADYTVPCFGFIALRPSALITAKGSRGVGAMYDLVDLPYEMPMCRNVRSHLDFAHSSAGSQGGTHTLKGLHRDLGWPSCGCFRIRSTFGESSQWSKL